MNNSPANIILINEFTPLEGKVEDSIHLLQKIKNNVPSCIYLSENEKSILNINSFGSLSELDEISQLNLKELNANLASDFKCQILSLKKVVKPQNSILPESKYLQLRHIEVPLHVLNDYHEWRESTIFKHVIKQQEIESFLAYHSIISTEPGVMFLSGFSCEINNYLDGFKQPSYIDIVKQAGEKYIYGGQSGLYTKIYKRL